jgi:hypothetical protein
LHEATELLPLPNTSPPKHHGHSTRTAVRVCSPLVMVMTVSEIRSQSFPLFGFCPSSPCTPPSANRVSLTFRGVQNPIPCPHHLSPPWGSSRSPTLSRGHHNLLPCKDKPEGAIRDPDPPMTPHGLPGPEPLDSVPTTLCLTLRQPHGSSTLLNHAGVSPFHASPRFLCQTRTQLAASLPSGLDSVSPFNDASQPLNLTL